MKKWAAVAASAGLLFYLTMAMAPDGPPADAAHDSDGAAAACRAAVEAGNPEGIFPLSPTVIWGDDSAYAVRGVLDTEINGASTRRNYDCVVRYDASAGYEVDSVSVWQSH